MNERIAKDSCIFDLRLKITGAKISCKDFFLEYTRDGLVRIFAIPSAKGLGVVCTVTLETLNFSKRKALLPYLRPLSSRLTFQTF